MQHFWTTDDRRRRRQTSSSWTGLTAFSSRSGFSVSSSRPTFGVPPFGPGIASAESSRPQFSAVPSSCPGSWPEFCASPSSWRGPSWHSAFGDLPSLSPVLQEPRQSLAFQTASVLQGWDQDPFGHSSLDEFNVVASVDNISFNLSSSAFRNGSLDEYGPSADFLQGGPALPGPSWEWPVGRRPILGRLEESGCHTTWKPLLGRERPERPTGPLLALPGGPVRPPLARWAKKSMYCPLCHQNGEMREMYQGHNLKDDTKVVCPVLRKFVCPTCGATGDRAHTASYCPKKPIGRAVGTTLKNTRHNAVGPRLKNGNSKHRKHSVEDD